MKFEDRALSLLSLRNRKVYISVDEIVAVEGAGELQFRTKDAWLMQESTNIYLRSGSVITVAHPLEHVMSELIKN